MAEQPSMRRTWRLVIPADIPLQVATPTSPVGEHPARRVPCQAPNCGAPTPHFLRTNVGIVHFCENHQRWALEAVESFWREEDKQA